MMMGWGFISNIRRTTSFMGRHGNGIIGQGANEYNWIYVDGSYDIIIVGTLLGLSG